MDVLPITRRQFAIAGPAVALGSAPDVVVFAAASLAEVLQAIGRTGPFDSIRFSFAASSTLARQIQQGAPAQLFISADAAWMDALQSAGHLLRGTRRNWVGNRLALVHASSAEPQMPPESAAAIEALIRPVLQQPQARIAVGDPAHVPAGRYAQAALTQLGLWDAVAPRLARADNVRGALALVERGEAPLGIVYRTDALASFRVSVAALFPASSHAPIVYPAALLQGATPAALRFHSHLFGGEAQALLRAAGFTVID